MIDFARVDSVQSLRRTSVVGSSDSPSKIEDVETRRLEAARLGDEIARLSAHIQAATYRLLEMIGDFDATAVRALANELFADFTGKTPYARVPQPWYATASAPQTFETPDKANAAMFGRLSLQINDQAPDFASLVVANRIFGGDPDSRLFKRVRVQDGLSYGVASVLQPASIDPNSTLVVYAIFAPENLARVKAATSTLSARLMKTSRRGALPTRPPSGLMTT